MHRGRGRNRRSNPVVGYRDGTCGARRLHVNALVLPGNHRSGNVFDPVDIAPKNILHRDRTHWISTMFQNHQLAPQMTTISVLLTRSKICLAAWKNLPVRTSGKQSKISLRKSMPNCTQWTDPIGYELTRIKARRALGRCPRRGGPIRDVAYDGLALI